MIVSWAALDDKREKIEDPISPTGLELELSTESEFLINTVIYDKLMQEPRHSCHQYRCRFPRNRSAIRSYMLVYAP